jgi:hypothetical protein
MGKIEPGDIHASPHELFESLLAVAGRANGTDYFGTTHGYISLYKRYGNYFSSIATVLENSPVLLCLWC